MEKRIAIIPARSGSKGLPDKNIRQFAGKPLLAYTVEAALGSGLFDAVHVSTDSEKYASIARECGADVRFLRSAEMSSDKADSWDAVMEVLENYKKLGEEFDVLALLQPTSPLRNSEHVKEAFETYYEKKANAVFSVCEADHPPAWYHPLGEDGDMSDFGDKEDSGKQRQDFAKYYRINGAIYIIDTGYFIEDRKDLYRDRIYAYIMGKRDSIDIDDKYDFEIAELLYGRRTQCQ